jgi:hypothetical protein
MSIHSEKGKYQTILGIAADIDRSEHPYVVAHLDKDRSINVDCCVHSMRDLFLCAEGVLTTLGHRCTDGAVPPGVKGGMETQECNLLIGISSLVGASLEAASPEFKQKLSHVLGNLCTEMVHKGKSIQEMHASQNTNTTKH